MTVGTYFLYGFILSISQFIFLGISSKGAFEDPRKPKLSEYLKFLILYVLLNTTGIRLLEMFT